VDVREALATPLPGEVEALEADAEQVDNRVAILRSSNIFRSLNDITRRDDGVAESN